MKRQAKSWRERAEEGEEWAREIAEKMDMPVEKIRKYMRTVQDPVSLETPVGDDEDRHLVDFVEDKRRLPAYGTDGADGATRFDGDALAGLLDDTTERAEQLAEREAQGHEIDADERALMQRALDENAVIVAQLSPLKAGEDLPEL